mgnify:CR=1 FL=1
MCGCKVKELPTLADGDVDLDLDSAGARIQAVLNQLLDNGRRTLDHFPGSDLVYQELW